MKVASNDDQLMILAKKRSQASYAANLRCVFQELDTDGSGQLSYEEFSRALDDPKMKTWLHALELEVNESRDLFQMLDDGDGEVSYDEFVYGAKRLKGTAQSVDLIAIMHEHRLLAHEIARLSGVIAKIDREVLFTISPAVTGSSGP